MKVLQCKIFWFQKSFFYVRCYPIKFCIFYMIKCEKYAVNAQNYALFSGKKTTNPSNIVGDPQLQRISPQLLRTNFDSFWYSQLIAAVLWHASKVGVWGKLFDPWDCLLGTMAATAICSLWSVMRRNVEIVFVQCQVELKTLTVFR